MEPFHRICRQEFLPLLDISALELLLHERPNYHITFCFGNLTDQIWLIDHPYHALHFTLPVEGTGCPAERSKVINTVTWVCRIQGRMGRMRAQHALGQTHAQLLRSIKATEWHNNLQHQGVLLQSQTMQRTTGLLRVRIRGFLTSPWGHYHQSLIMTGQSASSGTTVCGAMLIISG